MSQQTVSASSLHVRGDRIMLAVLGGYTLLSLALSPWYGTWAESLGIGLPVLAVSWAAVHWRSGSLLTRCWLAAALMIDVALTIQQGHGMIELHFGVFVMLAFQLTYRDWRPIISAAGTIAVHHVLFDRLQAAGYPIYLFNHQHTGIGMVAVHAAFVVFESIVLVYLAREAELEARAADQIAAAAARLASGDLSTRAEVGASNAVQSLHSAMATIREVFGQERIEWSSVQEQRQEAARVAEREREQERRAVELERERREAEQRREREQAARERAAAEELKRRIDEILIVVSAASQGDLSRRIARTSDDEVGRLGDGLNQFLTDMSGSLTGVARLAVELTSASKGLSGTSEGLTTVATTVASQAHDGSSASSRVELNAQSVAAATEEMDASIREIARSASEAAAVAREAVDAANDTNGTMSRLAESSIAIGKVVQTITGIARQTNLLALNATIEAARAGEVGRGFAIVAGEVKSLANETASATEDISHRIQAIQQDTAAAVEAIRRIGGIVGRIDGIQGTIAAAVEEQSTTTTEIGRNAASAARDSSEIARTVSGISESAQVARASAEDTRTAAQSLAVMARDLEAMLAHFQLDGSRTERTDGRPAPAGATPVVEWMTPAENRGRKLVVA